MDARPWPLVPLLLSAALLGVTAKKYQHCELARELRTKHAIPDDQLATWVCIAFHESRLDTSAVGRLSGNGLDHGLFQISDLYWCSPKGYGGACYLPCSHLEDDDITDDVKCARQIHREHTRYTGDGFNAWAVYQRGDCTPDKRFEFVKGCFDAPEHTEAPTQPPTSTSTTSTSSTTTTTYAPTSPHVPVHKQEINTIKRTPVS